jgi:hypothetical protein
VSIAALQNRPCGTLFGVIAYAFVPKPAAGPIKGNAVPVSAVPDDVALRDLVTLREPYITLLSTREQLSIARRFGYDYTRQASNVAAALLLLAVLGIVSSWNTLRHDVRLTAIASLITAAAVAVEQLWRLVALKTRPVGSFLAVLVRPFLKRLL